MNRITTRLLLTPLFVALACSKPPTTTTPSESSAPATAPAANPAPTAVALPAAEDVLAQAVEATGGAAALDAIHSYYSEARMEMPSQGLSANSRMWWKEGKFYMEVDMPGVGLSRVWCDGTKVTSEDPVNGRRMLEGKEATQARWSASLSLAHEWAKYFTQATTIEQRSVGGRPLVDIKLTGKDGDELVLSFDQGTHLLASQKFVQQSPMGGMPVEIAVLEYQQVAGLQTANKTEMRMAVLSATTTVTKFEVNVPVDDAKFTPVAADVPAPAGAQPPKSPKKTAKSTR